MIFLLSIFLLAGIESCKQNSKESKENTWSSEQKTKWKTESLQLMKNKNIKINDKDANAFCDCMLKKMSEKYTPTEAAKITTEEERKLWQECDYQW